MGMITDKVLAIQKAVTPPTLTDSLVEHNGTWITQRLRNTNLIGRSMHRKALDNKYLTCTRLDFDAIIQWDWTDNKTYIAEKYDCENFSFSFKARVDRRFYINTVGLVIDYEAGHAYNVIIFANGSMKIFEPQSDGWPKIGSKLYKFNRETVEVII